MLFAETTWPDVGMELVKGLVYLGGLVAVAWAGWLQLKQMSLKLEEVRTQSRATAVVGTETNRAVKEVKTDLAGNTLLTQDVHGLVNGTRTALLQRVKELEDAQGMSG